MLEILIFSIIQGITEFIPVSSSSHLIIISKLFNYSSSILLDISVHIGSFIAVITYFKKDLIGLFKNTKTLIFFVLASLPVILSGFVLISMNLINNLRTLEVIGWATILFGLFLYFSDNSKQEKDFNKNFNLNTALKIGIAQCFSLIPGVSRSGIVITASRFLKFSREESAKISFLLSIPTLFVISCYGFFKIFRDSTSVLIDINLIAIIFSFCFSFITIKYFLIFLKKFSLICFVIYRIILGIFLLLIVYL
tara:strand:- start:9890 stop:10645 length:756 start_codon:yes stop_codon:yes gene_type:complete